MPNRSFLIPAVLLLVWRFLFMAAFPAMSSSQQPVRNALPSIRPNERTFLVLSDIHFDPITGTDPSGLEALASSPVEQWQAILESHTKRALLRGVSDSNYDLLVSAMDATRTLGLRYDYILVAGDFLGHNFPGKYPSFKPDNRGYQEFVIKTMIFINRTIQRFFPAVPIVGALGNNDSAIGDYAFPGQTLLAALSLEWKAVGSSADATRDFLSGGYYSVPHPTVSNQDFIVLNTSLWSRLYSDTASANPADQGWREMNWLTSELERVRGRGRAATLVMHLPPGIDAYASQGGSCRAPAFFWKKPYLDAFLTSIGGHKDLLRDSYAGHTHISDFRVFDDASGRPYFLTHIAPSFSPEGHDPGFEIGVYNKADGALVDYLMFYLKGFQNADSSLNPAWEKAYDFRELSGFADYSPASLQAIALLLRSNEAIRSRLLNLFATHMSSTTSLAPQDWKPYSCAETEITTGAFAACACPPVSSSP
jgi:hypothetical protein